MRSYDDFSAGVERIIATYPPREWDARLAQQYPDMSADEGYMADILMGGDVMAVDEHGGRAMDPTPDASINTRK